MLVVLLWIGCANVGVEPHGAVILWAALSDIGWFLALRP